MIEQADSILKGRGAQIRTANPYLSVNMEPDWEHVANDQDYLDNERRPATVYLPDQSQTIVAENDSPDINFRYSVNPYRGCAHGCSYCYARPTHEFFGLSAGLDFETKVFVKERAPELFRDFLSRPNWKPQPIAFSGVTDPYQPIERKLRLTRGCLEVAAEFHQPVGIVTKNALVTRDIEVLQELARHRQVHVALSLTTLDEKLARSMEPRTSSPQARLRAIEQLSKAGIPTLAMVAPVIPGLNDSEIPAILRAARDVGAEGATYVLLRLPTTVGTVFFDWLEKTLPNQAEKIRNRIRSTRNGRVNSAKFGQRMTGTGAIAEQIRDTFQFFAKRYGLAKPLPALNCSAFKPTRLTSGQQLLF